MHLLKKRKTTFQDPPDYLPECFPKLQGPLKTPQTPRDLSRIGSPETSPGPPGDAPKTLPGLPDFQLTLGLEPFSTTMTKS